MTEVSLRGLHTALGEPEPTTGQVTIEYWAGTKPFVRVAGADVIFPAKIVIPIIEGDPGTIELAPTLSLCCVKWTVESDKSWVPVVEYTEIPATGTIDFGSLVKVNPLTFTPTEDNIAAWEAAIQDAYLVVGQVEQAGVEAVNDVTQAGNLAKTEIAADKQAAEQAAQDAQTAKTASETAKTDAEAARTGSETAKADAEAAKVDAQNARDETVVSVTTQSDWVGAVILTQAQSKSSYLRRRLTGNTVVTVNPGVAGKAYSCTLELQQDANGSRTITLVNVATPYGVAIPLSSTANAVDIIRLEWNGSRWAAYLGGTQLVIPTSWVV